MGTTVLPSYSCEREGAFLMVPEYMHEGILVILSIDVMVILSHYLLQVSAHGLVYLLTFQFNFLFKFTLPACDSSLGHAVAVV